MQVFGMRGADWPLISHMQQATLDNLEFPADEPVKQVKGLQRSQLNRFRLGTRRMYHWRVILMPGICPSRLKIGCDNDNKGEPAKTQSG
jgi:hypothetical protein